MACSSSSPPTTSPASSRPGGCRTARRPTRRRKAGWPAVPGHAKRPSRSRKGRWRFGRAGLLVRVAEALAGGGGEQFLAHGRRGGAHGAVELAEVAALAELAGDGVHGGAPTTTVT